MSRATPLIALLLTGLGCGARTGTIDDPPPDGRMPPVPTPEVCNGLDDDLDGLTSLGVFDAGPVFDADLFVDEDFRDEIGRYVHPDHCGACNVPCVATGRALEVSCALVEESPTCVAVRCEPGYAPSSTGRCVPIYDRLCLACADDGDCGDLEEASCSLVGGERRCTVGCVLGCPEGYTCTGDVCAPSGGSCSCEPGDDFTLACALFDPEGNRCPGATVCADGVIGECVAPEEVCDEVDNNCDGVIDEGYRDERDAYSLDIHNCGECGVDCTLSTVPEGDLICGGDPFAPTCVLECPDAADGIMPGDRIDADRNIATGCECTVTSLTDDPGPVGAEGPMLDLNCDGADGIVVESFYVAPDGNDAGPGSPTRPLATLSVAVARAAESLTMRRPRPHVFVASGIYTESVEVPDGVLVHGGYRRDFLALDPVGFRVEVRAPTDTTAPGGAALVLRGVGATRTRIEWLEARGLDALGPGMATFAIYALDPGGQLTLSELRVVAGVPGDGAHGADGTAGRDFDMPPAEGAPPRGGMEDGAHMCVPGPANVVTGGAGGQNVCDRVDVRGGDGGSPHCPEFTSFQPDGAAGNPAGSIAGGSGGAGGQDSRGPIMGISCSEPVCCGLADFTVPTDFRGPQPGRAGSSGPHGTAGAGCRDAAGSFMGDLWIGDVASGGSDGRPGSGGGGGGAGCAGTRGTGGLGGGGSFGIFIASASVDATNNTITTGNGGVGGRGGNGGDGGGPGAGGTGGSGADDAAGGGNGSSGGRGGHSGSGSGGPGGPSYGMFQVTAIVTSSGNTIMAGTGGAGGAGGTAMLGTAPTGLAGGAGPTFSM
ncbi:MAG: hypothetical protein H6719_30630 [Sandaracinaceae bacterium]|nr:hypothetical protein [Sandaracinaceae bacterium]